MPPGMKGPTPSAQGEANHDPHHSITLAVLGGYGGVTIADGIRAHESDQ